MSAAVLPADFLGIALVVLLPGMRHGFDADYLTAILHDAALTRDAD